jgi:cyclic beta-1,2-glucan synthetase
VISGAGELHCSARAMAAVEKYLVRRDDGLVLLFTPPFDKASPNPGYIKGYPPGIRENGGQYTHAALWTVLAFAMMGDGDKAYDVLSLLNPIHHAGNSAAIHRYRVEPYVVCADIYSAPPHVGRGGWTWYTGSAGWMYRVAVESVLGLRLEGSSLVVDPCIPRSWPRFDARLRHGGSLYEITVENPNRVGHGVLAADLDGKRIDGRAARVTLVDDGATHRLRVTLG